MFWMFCFLLYFQLVSIITDETPIEQMRNRLMIKDRGSSSSSSTTHSSQLPHHPTHTRKPKLALLREVFGRGWHIISHEHTESKAPMVSCQSFHVKLLCRLLQVQSFAGSFPFTPTPHLLAASPTLPSLTMTSDFGLRVKSKKKKSCFCVWVTIRAWIFTAQLWRLILRPVRWRGREEKSGPNVSTQWTNDSFFLALGWSRYLDWRESFASDRCCPTLREKLILTTCNFSLFWRVWNVCLEFDWWGWRPRLQHSDTAALQPF